MDGTLVIYDPTVFSNPFKDFYVYREMCLWDLTDGRCIEHTKFSYTHTGVQVRRMLILNVFEVHMTKEVDVSLKNSKVWHLSGKIIVDSRPWM